MLRQLLDEIASGRGSSPANLARRLDISEALLAQLLENLERKGYLALQETMSTSGNCDTCSLHKQCKHCTLSLHSASKRWLLTAKGRRVAQGVDSSTQR